MTPLSVSVKVGNRADLCRAGHPDYKRRSSVRHVRGALLGRCSRYFAAMFVAMVVALVLLSSGGAAGVAKPAKGEALLVYFDGEKLEEDKESLWPHVLQEEAGTGGGFRPRTRTDKSSWLPGPRAKLSAGVVNVPEGWVLSGVFDEDDLYSAPRRGEKGSSGPD